MISNVSHFENGVGPQLTLNTQHKLHIISLVDLPGQLVNLRAAQNRRAVEESGTETNRWTRLPFRRAAALKNVRSRWIYRPQRS